MIRESAVKILVIDAPGVVLDVVRRACPDISFQRVGIPSRPKLSPGYALVLVAIYGRADWQRVQRYRSAVPTVFVATSDSRSDVHRARAARGFGLLHTGLAPAALRRSIVGALNGEPAFSRAVLGELMKTELKAAGAKRQWELTPRQREVGGLIARGASDREIAGSLGITTSTAQKHVQGLLRRLGAPNRAAAVAAMMS